MTMIMHGTDACRPAMRGDHNASILSVNDADALKKVIGRLSRLYWIAIAPGSDSQWRR